MSLIGIDLGGTKVQGVLVDDGQVVADAKLPTPTSGVHDVVAAVVGCVARLGGPTSADGIGIGAPGVVEPGTGTLVRAPNLVGFEGRVPLAALLGEALGLPSSTSLVVDNDVNAAVVAEHRLGAGQGSDDVLGVWVGTGVGGGMILDGRLRRGPAGGAGEIGHVGVVVDGGRQCGCGLFGHLESYAGRASMESEARRRHQAGKPTRLVELAGDKRMKSSVFLKAFDAGDEVTLELLDEAVRALGVALASAATLVDLQLVVVGGGLAGKLGPRFVGRIEQAVRSRLFVRPSPLRVVPATLGELAGAVGAALLASGPAAVSTALLASGPGA
ncbi:MAG: ROK family protein [Actinomycetota bacterium]|nr:ROK family protein [Actinomycetota bacterium]